MSFISVEPQSRALSESYSNGLLAQFDTQLEIISDRYLDFFQERSVHFVLSLALDTDCSVSGDVLRQPSQLSSEKLEPTAYLG
jgi:hypothetical protein